MAVATKDCITATALEIFHANGYSAGVLEVPPSPRVLRQQATAGSRDGRILP